MTLLNRGRLTPLLIAAVLLPAGAQAARSPYAPPALLEDATSGNLTDAQEELVKGSDPDPISEDGKTPLIVAAQHHNAAMVQLLLANKANANKRDPDGKTALFWAAEQGDVEVIDALVQGHAKVDLDAKSGVTPLMAAARAGQDDAVAHLLAGGADASRSDYSGRDALGWAQDGRNAHVVELLKAALKH